MVWQTSLNSPLESNRAQSLLVADLDPGFHLIHLETVSCPFRVHLWRYKIKLLISELIYHLDSCHRSWTDKMKCLSLRTFRIWWCQLLQEKRLGSREIVDKAEQCSHGSYYRWINRAGFVCAHRAHQLHSLRWRRHCTTSKDGVYFSP